MKITDRFLKYVAFDTQSNAASITCPSSPGQLTFAKALAKELEEIGLTEISLDDNSYLMATLEANPGNKSENIPTIGFIAHLDTSSDMPGKNVKPQIIRYQGGDIILSEKENIRISPELFPEISAYKGQEIVVTDGTTLLGADDKAGIAAIVSAMEYLVEHPEITHGKVRIAFTPDEEIGRGADLFDVETFGCAWAYTVDGGELGELEYENFNAASAEISFKGRNIHPGMAAGKMINAALLAATFISRMPAEMRPENTTGYEGFYHLTRINAGVEEAQLSYLIREHDRTRFEQMKERLTTLVADMNREHPNCASLCMTNNYYNMSSVIASHPHIVDLASKAMQAAGVQPLITPIRGGTDGARLSFMGLPCPNIFAGGHNFHGRYEFLPLPSLEKSMNTIIKIVELL